MGKAKEDPQKRLARCYEGAQQFFRAFDILEKIQEETPAGFISIPLYVNGCFAIELALKYLIEATTGKAAIRKHELHTLFDQLLEPVQNRILVAHRKYIKERCADQVPDDLDAEFFRKLDELNKGFEDYRYLYATEAFDDPKHRQITYTPRLLLMPIFVVCEDVTRERGITRARVTLTKHKSL